MISTIRHMTTALALGALISGAQAEPARIPGTQAVRNIVLVHGAFADGSGWRGVYDILSSRGYRVSIVQNPLTSFADDVNATRRILARQTGPSILVGHSYGGSVITEAGTDASVAGLVYVSALAPDVGESTGDQFKQIPAPPEFVIEPGADGWLRQYAAVQDRLRERHQRCRRRLPLRLAGANQYGDLRHAAHAGGLAYQAELGGRCDARPSHRSTPSPPSG